MGKVMLRISKLAPAALLAAGMLTAGEAWAQRGCSPLNPNMRCDLATCQALEAAVKAPDSCSTQQFPLSGCDNISGCFNLTQAKNRWLKCYETRTRLNMACFTRFGATDPDDLGGDEEHQTKAAIAITKASECQAKMKLPAPTGCGKDPC